MFLTRRCNLLWCQARHKSSVPRNHYESLGVKSNATQAEIKSAYYALSKIHHPDTNQGDDASSAKFRQVADAYQVLGNVTSRRLYDRGLVVGTSGTSLRQDVEDDPTTTFYRKREKRDKVPTPLDRTTIYDFDAWARAHYLHAKGRKMAAKERYHRTEARLSESSRLRRTQAYFVTGTLFMLLIFSALSYESHDKSILAEKKLKKEGT